MVAPLWIAQLIPGVPGAHPNEALVALMAATAFALLKYRASPT